MNLPGKPIVGEPPSADWAGQVVDCLKALRVSGCGRARVSQTPEGTTISVADAPVPRSPGGAVRFEAVEEHGDFLLCARIDSLDASQQPVPVEPGEEGETLYKVWKPWLLRETPFDTLTRDGITYDYHATTTGLRKATDAEDTEEWQAITPSYSLRTTGETAQAGELLHATPVGDNEFQDINTAGRCWAETDAPEEA